MDTAQVDSEKHCCCHAPHPCLEVFSLPPLKPSLLLHAYDFKRLYTNIDTADIKAQIMRLVSKIFAAHPAHGGIKVWQKAPVV